MIPRADRILLGGAEEEGLKFLYSGMTYEEDDRSQPETKAVALSESYRESSIRLEVSYVEKMGYTERIKIRRRQRLGSFGGYPHNVFFLFTIYGWALHPQEEERVAYREHSRI